MSHIFHVLVLLALMVLFVAGVLAIAAQCGELSTAEKATITAAAQTVDALWATEVAKDTAVIQTPPTQKP